MDANDLLHAIQYGTLPDPHAATKRRIAELETKLAGLQAEQAADLAAAQPPDRYRIVLFDMTGATIADGCAPDLESAAALAVKLNATYGEVARVKLRGFEVGYVVGGRWVAR